MNSKIEKSFQNSQFYKNYNNIDNVILKFKKIKNEYKSSKNKYKNEMISIIDILNKNQVQSKFLKKIITFLSDKYGSNILENYLNVLFHIKININENKLDSCRKILNKKINISHDIKKYIKYSENINDNFIRSIKIGNIKNINFLINNGVDIHYKNDKALTISSKHGNIEVVKFLIENGVNIHAKDDNALLYSSKNGNIEVVNFLVENGANIHAGNDICV